MSAKLPGNGRGRHNRAGHRAHLGVSSHVLVAACLVAGVVAWLSSAAAQPAEETADLAAGGSPAVGGSGGGGEATTNGGAASGGAAPTSPSQTQIAHAPPPGGYRSGLFPRPGNQEVPLAWMPPGSQFSPVPSDEIFPPQTIPLRFNHEKHVGELMLSCKVCHAAAYDSFDSHDRLLPNPSETCDSCHDVDHSDPNSVIAGTEEHGQCVFCHTGDNAGVDGRVARVVIPDPNLRFPHAKHLARNIDCAQCHGQIDKLELATREQLPRMAGCFSCHAKSGAAQGEAQGACTTCHLTEPTGTMKVAFESGPLVPPQWMHAAAHTPDWIERHRTVAGADSGFCGSCHQENFCVDCHDGRVRPRRVHPNDWLSMHAQSARMDNPRCVSCHQQQTFCASCHRRVGVARDVASGNRPSGRRFHPPGPVWTTGPRGPDHHAWEAQRNLNACVSCHSERDCATCHATKGVAGGQGVNPHPVGFSSRCAGAFQRNPRPCLVCHDGEDPRLGACR